MGFDIFEALNACRHHLVRCGGHQAAAGFDIQAANLPAFREALREFAKEELDEELLQPCVRVDAELPLSALDMRLAQELSRLEPYGHGNQEPVFVTRGFSILEQRRLPSKVQNGPDHVKLRLDHPSGRQRLDALFWRAWARAPECPPNGRIDACYTMEVSSYNGFRNLQLHLKDLRGCESG